MPCVAVRSAHLNPPSLRFIVGGGPTQARIVSLEGSTAYVRLGTPPEPGQSLEADWTGPGRFKLSFVVDHVTPPAPDGASLCRLTIRRLTSLDGEDHARAFLTSRLGVPATDFAITRTGQSWWAQLTDEPDAAPEEVAPTSPEFKGPPPRVSGQRATEEAPQGLDTGREATTVEGLQAFFVDSGQRVGTYLNVPCSYTVAGAQYWGRALRLNDRFVQVNTASVVPGLGVRMRCDLTLEVDSVRRPVSLYGILSQKKDPPSGAAYKASLLLRYNRIDEGDSPGLLIEFLARKAREKQGQAEQED